MAMVNMNNLLNGKDSRWLQLEVCREFQRNKCSRPDTECKFAHPPANVEVQNGRVTACYDSIKVRICVFFFGIRTISFHREQASIELCRTSYLTMIVFFCFMTTYACDYYRYRIFFIVSTRSRSLIVLRRYNFLFFATRWISWQHIPVALIVVECWTFASKWINVFRAGNF